MTWYPKDFIKIPMTDMRMRPDPATKYPGRTYRFYNGKTVFEFGYGLSFSTYSYNITVSRSAIFYKNFSTNQAIKSWSNVRHLSVNEISAKSCEEAKFSTVVAVENSGNLVGTHPVLLFVRQDSIANGSPIKQLIGFRSLSLMAGAKAEIQFTVSPCDHFSTASEDGAMVIEGGPRFLNVGEKMYRINVIL